MIQDLTVNLSSGADESEKFRKHSLSKSFTRSELKALFHRNMHLEPQMHELGKKNT